MFIESNKGTPQGGVISPLLANIYLNQLDREFEKRGHRFVRYADDFCIYVKTPRAGERVLDSVTNFLEKKLKLTVNTEKSKVSTPGHAKFLGFTIWKTMGKLDAVHIIRLNNNSKRLKQLTSRKRPGTFEDIVKEINQYTQGWINYYGIGVMKNFIRETAQWLNHRLRQLIWKRWKRICTRFYRLMRYGIDSKKPGK